MTRLNEKIDDSYEESDDEEINLKNFPPVNEFMNMNNDYQKENTNNLTLKNTNNINNTQPSKSNTNNSTNIENEKSLGNLKFQTKQNIKESKRFFNIRFKLSLDKK
jgi:hypothetical protein